MQYVCAILSSVACTTLHYFSTLSHFRQKKSYKKLHTCEFLFSRIYEVFLILGRNERDIIKMYIGLHVK